MNIHQQIGKALSHLAARQKNSGAEVLICYETLVF